MSLFSRLLRLCLHRCSELERELGRPGSSIPFTQVWLRRHGVIFGAPLWIGPDFRLINHGSLSLGERCGIGSGARIFNQGKIEVGDDFIAAPGLTLNSGTHDLATMKFINNRISIGHRVWCGVNVTIIGETKIGNNSVVAAGAVVKGVFPPDSVIGGVPARVLKAVPPERDAWRLRFQ